MTTACFDSRVFSNWHLGLVSAVSEIWSSVSRAPRAPPPRASFELSKSSLIPRLISTTLSLSPKFDGIFQRVVGRWAAPVILRKLHASAQPTGVFARARGVLRLRTQKKRAPLPVLFSRRSDRRAHLFEEARPEHPHSSDVPCPDVPFSDVRGARGVCAPRSQFFSMYRSWEVLALVVYCFFIHLRVCGE